MDNSSLIDIISISGDTTVNFDSKDRVANKGERLLGHALCVA